MNGITAAMSDPTWATVITNWRTLVSDGADPELAWRRAILSVGATPGILGDLPDVLRAELLATTPTLEAPPPGGTQPPVNTPPEQPSFPNLNLGAGDAQRLAALGIFIGALYRRGTRSNTPTPRPLTKAVVGGGTTNTGSSNRLECVPASYQRAIARAMRCRCSR